MATLYATHGAAAVKQINAITVANTWAAADTAIMTMNGKALTVTIGADSSTTQVATAIRDAWNATSRLDSEGSTDATSNFGGQEFGEFAEATASIDPDAASVVIITANKAGVPFTLTVTESTAGSGTATGATSQTATGPWHWDNAKNWDTGAVPANDDIVVLKDQSGPNVGFKYGLPNNSLEVTIQHWMSYTGQIGLPPINIENVSKPYPEYRQRYVRLDDAGTGTNIAHRFGIGKEGTGSPLINLKHSTLKCSPIVFNTGTAQIAGLKALNICCLATTSVLNIVNGSVDCGTQDGGTPAWTTINISNGSVRCFSGLSSLSAFSVYGGDVVVGGASPIGAINANGTARVRIENQSAAITNSGVADSAVMECLASGITITTHVQTGGTFDASGGAGTLTITDATLYEPASFFDPGQRITYTNQVKFYGELSAKLKFGGTQSNYVSITP